MFGKMLCYLCLVAWITVANAYPGGAPNSTCQNMIPVHNEAISETSTSPYQIIVDSNSLQPGGTIKVTLKAPSDQSFAGFLLQGKTDDNTVIGTFTANDDTKTIQCFGKPDSAATHNSRSRKTSLDITWKAPIDYQGNVNFNATIVESYSKFWANVAPSQKLLVSGAPVIPEATSTAQPLEEESTSPFSWIYDNCYESKGCFGGPTGCVEKRTCSHIVTYSLNGSKFDFQMMTKTIGWAGIGFSDDQYMGGDAVTVCAVNGSTSYISIFQTWNLENNKDNEVLEDMTMGLSNLYSKNDDGFTYCSFTLDSQLLINNKQFEFLNQSYYLFLARGKMQSRIPPVKLNIHLQTPYKTSASVFLRDVSPIGMASNTLIKLHGCLMTIAWIGTVSLAIFLARFYKQTWTDVVHCKQKVWFTWHRLLNILTVLLTIAGVVVIFLQLQGWSQVWRENLHPILGIITTGLAILQPIMAAFRCHPGTPRRPIFNVLHFCVGNAAYILAIVTLFLAKKLAKASLPDFYMWILIAFVVFHVTIFLIMEAFVCFKGKTLRGNQIAMKDMAANGNAYHVSDQNTEAPGSRFRKFMLSVYIFGNVCFVTALVATVAVSPVKEL